jgi:hypothetical protein
MHDSLRLSPPYIRTTDATRQDTDDEGFWIMTTHFKETLGYKDAASHHLEVALSCLDDRQPEAECCTKGERAVFLPHTTIPTGELGI